MIVVAGALSHHQRRGPNAPVRRASAIKALGLAFAGWATVKALRSVTDGSPARTRRGRLPEPPPEGERGGALGARAQPLEIVLHEEQVLIEKRVVPRKRARVTKQLITEQRPLSAELRREEIVLEQNPPPANAITTERQ